MGHRKNNNNNSTSDAPAVQCDPASSDIGGGSNGGGGGPQLTSEKSPISALIQKFSSCSSSSSSSSSSSVPTAPATATCPGQTGASIAGNIVNSNSNNCTRSANSEKVNASDTNSHQRMTNVSLSSGSRKEDLPPKAVSDDEVDFSKMAISSSGSGSSSCCPALSSTGAEQIVPRVKVNNSSSNKLTVHSSHQQREEAASLLTSSSPGGTLPPRKSSDTGQLRGLLLGEDKNASRTNGHIYNSARKLSADFRLPHRDLLHDENGKHYGHKPVRVKNLANRSEAYDMLHNKTVEKVSVGEGVESVDLEEEKREKLDERDNGVRALI